MARGHIALHPESKVLVLGSDIARYGLNSDGEATQGAGAVAMVISANPHILALEDKSAYLTANVMDFWRPVYLDTGIVNGKLSIEKYISFFKSVWEDYKTQSGYSIEDFTAICFHLPYTKMGQKALRSVYDQASEGAKERLITNLEASSIYTNQVGNIYTGSLYLSLISLLEQQEELPDGAKIGMFSYGSGAVGEFFTGILQPGYRNYLNTNYHKEVLASRTELSVEDYELVFEDTLATNGSTVELDIQADPAEITLSGISDHIRHYVHKDKKQVFKNDIY